jgi:hypothetical protein
LWERAGFFEAIWAMALEEYDDLKGLEGVAEHGWLRYKSAALL